jgi:hypothetical protein
MILRHPVCAGLLFNYAALCQEGTKDEDCNKSGIMLSIVRTGVLAR